MKLSFSTLGCPTWDIDTIIARARQYGYDGVDFRGYRGEMEIFKLPEFTTDAQTTAGKFASAGIEVAGFASSVSTGCSPQEFEKWIPEFEHYVRLCRIFKAPIIRIFGGHLKQTTYQQALENIATNYRRLCQMAGDVLVGIETHDDWIASNSVVAVMEKVAMPNACVIWDVHHPYRFCGERPQYTWDRIGRWVRLTHFKDGVVKADGKHTYTLAGKGDIPMDEFMRILKAGGFDGYAMVEWEKKWHPDIAEPQDAFPSYANYLRPLM